MRKFFNVMFAVVALLSITFVGCGDEPEVTPKPQPTLVLSQSEIDVPAEGGDYSVQYTLTDPVEGITIVAECNEEWVHLIEPTDTNIMFSVDANSEAQSRTAIVEVSYGDSATSQITISQAEYVAPAPFTIEIESVEATSCITQTYAEDDDMWYVMYLVNKSYFTEYGILTAEDLFADDKATYMKNAEFDGMNLGEYMETYQAIFQGDKRVEWSNMTVTEQSVIYVYGIQFNEDRTDYTMITDVYYEMITPKTADILEGTFSVDISVDGPEATFNITPEGWNEYYTFEVYDTSDPMYIEEGEEISDDYVRQIAGNWMENCMMNEMYYGYTKQDILDSFCYTGNKSITQELFSEVKYCIVIYGVKEVDGLLQLVTQPVVKHFATQRVEKVDMTLNISVENIGSRVADITVTPSLEDEKYMLLLMPTEYIVSTTEEDIIYELMTDYFNYASFFRGEMHSHVSTLNDNTSYTIYCMGFHGGVVTTPLYSHEFKTEVAELGEISVESVEILGPYAATDLAEALPDEYGSYGIYDNSYVVTIEPKTNIDTEDIFYTTWDYDTFDYYNTNYPSIVIDDTRAFYCEKVGISSLCDYGWDFLVTAIAMDKKGNLSELYVTECFNYTAEDNRPIDELVATLSKAGSKARVMLFSREQLHEVVTKNK